MIKIKLLKMIKIKVFLYQTCFFNNLFLFFIKKIFHLSFLQCNFLFLILLLLKHISSLGYNLDSTVLIQCL